MDAAPVPDRGPWPRPPTPPFTGSLPRPVPPDAPGAGFASLSYLAFPSKSDSYLGMLPKGEAAMPLTCTVAPTGTRMRVAALTVTLAVGWIPLQFPAVGGRATLLGLIRTPVSGCGRVPSSTPTAP